MKMAGENEIEEGISKQTAENQDSINSYEIILRKYCLTINNV